MFGWNDKRRLLHLSAKAYITSVSFFSTNIWEGSRKKIMAGGSTEYRMNALKQQLLKFHMYDIELRGHHVSSLSSDDHCVSARCSPDRCFLQIVTKWLSSLSSTHQVFEINRCYHTNVGVHRHKWANLGHITEYTLGVQNTLFRAASFLSYGKWMFIKCVWFKDVYCGLHLHFCADSYWASQ